MKKNRPSHKQASLTQLKISEKGPGMVSTPVHHESEASKVENLEKINDDIKDLPFDEAIYY
jgi:hypothetical protein